MHEKILPPAQKEDGCVRKSCGILWHRRFNLELPERQRGSFLGNLWRNNEKITIKFLPASVNSSFGISNPHFKPTVGISNPPMKLFYRMRFYQIPARCKLFSCFKFGQKMNKFVTHQTCTFSLACVFPISRNNAIEELLRSPAANSNMAADKLHGLPPR
jgi:hypothetical protein